MPVSDWLTIDDLRRKLDYDPETGKLTWKELRNSRRVGAEAKSLDVGGYVQVSFGVGRIAKGHRLAWAHYYGEWPKGHIDHINGIRDDNRIANLRDVDGTTNTQNKRVATPRSKTGVLGVVKVGARYQANIHKNRKKYYLGSYDTPEQAHEVYVQAKRQLHEGCTL